MRIHVAKISRKKLGEELLESCYDTLISSTATAAAAAAVFVLELSVLVLW